MFIEPAFQISSSSVGAKCAADVAPTELGGMSRIIYKHIAPTELGISDFSNNLLGAQPARARLRAFSRRHTALPKHSL
jgi:hypothetical protein